MYNIHLHSHHKVLFDTYNSSSSVSALHQYKKAPENNLPLLLQLVANGFVYQVCTINLKLAQILKYLHFSKVQLLKK